MHHLKYKELSMLKIHKLTDHITLTCHLPVINCHVVKMYKVTIVRYF